jgi:hypothetical protein
LGLGLGFGVRVRVRVRVGVRVRVRRAASVPWGVEAAAVVVAWRDSS